MSKHQIRLNTVNLMLILSFLLVAFGCQFFSSGILSPTPTPIGVSVPPDEAWYSVHFTTPGSPEANSYHGGPGAAVAEAIQKAHIGVDVAAYTFNLWEIRDALLDAQRRGLTVRMVTDSDRMEEREIRELIEAGIPVKGDRSDSLMHNKFFIIDRNEVWTGSMNPTLGGAFYDNNNLVRIKSSEVAALYEDEFEEMFVDMAFSRGSMEKTVNNLLTIDSTLVEVYFSPEDGTAHRIVELIENADESVYFLAYAFTADDIAAAMISQASSGLDVAGVMDLEQYRSNIGTEYKRLLSGGVDVYLDENSGLMHHKVIILDEHIVITGSYNFSASAEKKNDENTIIFHNSNIAAIFLEEFRRVYNEAKR